MRYRLITVLFVLVGIAGAADDAVIAPHQVSAAVSAAIDNRQPAVAEGIDAITIPKLLSYQGRLFDAGGEPVPDSTWSVRFALYQDNVGQIPFWFETRDVVTTSGLFSVLLGVVNPVESVPSSGNLYLGMKVGADPEMRPRLRIASAAYSLLTDRARFSDTADFARSTLLAGDSADGDFAVAGEVRGYGPARFGLQCAANDSLGFAAGMADTATGLYSAVVGGVENAASGRGAFIGGGEQNRVTGDRAAVLGGWRNEVSGNNSAVVGGSNCLVDVNFGFAAGAGSQVTHSQSAAFNGQSTTASNQLRCGTLSKTGGSFTVDHPADPYGKVLNHYFTEGPEMLNIYRGSVVLDASGRAEAVLPGYFSSLNRDPMVHLTGVGTPDVYVAEDVSGNRFTIGGPAGAKVYWQVTGERKDVSAEAIRRMMPVEQPKTGELAGTMLDDDFLSGCMDQLVREGKAQGIDFRTAAGRMRYVRMKRAIEGQ